MDILNSYSEANIDSFVNVSAGSTKKDGVGQSFIAQESVLNSVKFYVKMVGVSTGNIYAKLYLSNLSSPVGSAAITSTPFTSFELFAQTTDAILIEFVFNPYPLVAGQEYVISCEYAEGTNNKYIQVGVDSSGIHLGQNVELSNGVWTVNSSKDTAFYLFGTFPEKEYPMDKNIKVGNGMSSSSVNI